MKTISTIQAIHFFVCIGITGDLSAQQKTFEKTFGGSRYDSGHMIAWTADGGFVITGQTMSYGDTLGDTYVIKVDSLAKQEWTKITGGNKLEGGNSIAPASDGG